MTRSRSDIERDIHKYNNLNLNKPMLVSQLTQYSNSLSNLQAELTALPTANEKSSHEELASHITTLQEKTSSFLNAPLDTRSSRQNPDKKEEKFSLFPELMRELQENILSFSSYHDLSLMKNISHAFTLLINRMPAPEHLLRPFQIILSNPNNPIILQYNHFVKDDKQFNDSKHQREDSASVTDNSQEMGELTEKSQNSLSVLKLAMKVVDENLKEQLQINRESIVKDMGEEAESTAERIYTVSSASSSVFALFCGGSTICVVMLIGSLTWDGIFNPAMLTSVIGLGVAVPSCFFRHRNNPSSLMGSICGFFSERRARARAESSLQQFSLTRAVTTSEPASVVAESVEAIESDVEDGQENSSINRTLLSSTSSSSSRNR